MKFCTFANETLKSKVQQFDPIMEAEVKGTKEYTCEICENVFLSKKSLHRHLQNIHHQEARNQCDLCDRSFQTKPSLRYHISFEHKTQSNRRGPQ